MTALSDQAKKEMYFKYKRKLDEQLGQSTNIKEGPDTTYSAAYQIFRREQISVGHSLFERLCNGAERIFKLKLKQADIDKLLPSLEMTHLTATPQGVY